MLTYKRGLIWIAAIAVCLVLAGCGSKTEFTYEVTGTAAEVTIEYTAANGNLEKVTTALPWKETFAIGDKFSFQVSATNATGSGNVACAVSVDGHAKGDASGNQLVKCSGDVSKKGNGILSSFQGQSDPQPEVKSTPAAPAATPAPVAARSGPAQLSFTSKRDGNLEIYLVNADGTDLTNLTQSPSDDQSAAWAPDGNRLVFTSNRDGMPSLYILDVEAALQGERDSAVTRLTDFPSGNAAWSPDGKLIAFLGDNSGKLDIYLINPDGAGLKNLNLSPGPGGGPAWSPDSTQLAFYSAQDGNPEIYGVAVDGSGLTRFTDDAGIDVTPDWSPLGKPIAFASNRDGDFEIFLLNPDKSVRQVTNNTSAESNPDWSPDGKQLAFESNIRGNNDIFIIQENNAVAQLTDHSADDTQARWRP